MKPKQISKKWYGEIFKLRYGSNQFWYEIFNGSINKIQCSTYTGRKIKDTGFFFLRGFWFSHIGEKVERRPCLNDAVINTAPRLFKFIGERINIHKVSTNTSVVHSHERDKMNSLRWKIHETITSDGNWKIEVGIIWNS